MPAPSIARNASIASRCTSATLRRRQVGGNHRLRPVVEVLRLVVVELARRDDLAGTEASGSSLPSTAHSISRASGTPASTTTLRSNSSASSIAGDQLVGGLHLRDADARSEVGRLDEQRQPERERRRRATASRSRSQSARDERRATARPAGRAPRTAPSSPPCPCRRPRPARRRRRTARWPARAGPAPCRPRRTGRAAPGTRRRGRAR